MGNCHLHYSQATQQIEVQRNQNICTSRNFGDMVSNLPSLKASVAHFAASCANKLRGQGSVCGTVTVFISSNRFREDLQQYGNASSFSFITGTSDTMEITQAALKCLDAIFVPGIMYKKSGVIVGNITPSNPIQLDLFDTNPKRKERNDLMRAMDDINHRYGVKTLHLAVEGFPSPANGGTEGGVKTIEEHQQWHVKCEHRSPRSAFAACKSKNYLTNINEILTIKI